MIFQIEIEVLFFAKEVIKYEGVILVGVLPDGIGRDKPSHDKIWHVDLFHPFEPICFYGWIDFYLYLVYDHIAF